MNAPPPIALAQAQENALRKGAAANGDWTRLAFFYWQQGNEGALDQMRTVDGEHDANLTIFLELTTSSDSPLLNRYDVVTKPWILYYLTRYWLSMGELPRAIACAKRSLEIAPGHAPAFSLILHYAKRTGQTPLIASLTSKLLGMSPEQTDIHLLAATPEKVFGPSDPLRLDDPRVQIGFYVPVFNAAAVLSQVLDGLLHQAYPLHDFVVVDDASTDDSAAIAETYPARLLRHPQNRGLAAARNTALNSITSEFVGSCDSDAVLDPDYLIYASIELQSAHFPLAGAGGRMTEHYTDGIANHWRSVHLNQDTGCVRKCSGNREGVPIYLPGCNTVMRREAVLKLGGYDESHVAVGEDGYINRALHESGFGLATTPLARCRHLRRDTPNSVLRTRWNYEWEGHQNALAFACAGSLIRLFKVHFATAKGMVEHDHEKGVRGLLPMEVLYVYVLFLHSLRHARLTGALTLGEERWFQCVLTRSTLCGDTPSGRRLRDWRDCQIEPLLLPPDAPLDPPSPYLATLYRAALADFESWLGTVLTDAKLSALIARR